MSKCKLCDALAKVSYQDVQAIENAIKNPHITHVDIANVLTNNRIPSV